MCTWIVNFAFGNCPKDVLWHQVKDIFIILEKSNL